VYEPPHVYSDGRADPFNDVLCRCADGGIEYRTTLIGCGGDCRAPVCEAGTTEGEPCTADTNGECAAELTDAGRVETVCACDVPGPIWRCANVRDE